MTGMCICYSMMHKGRKRSGTVSEQTGSYDDPTNNEHIFAASSYRRLSMTVAIRKPAGVARSNPNNIWRLNLQ